MNPIFKQKNCYMAMQGGDKAPKKVTNFVMRPVNAIDSIYANLLDVEFTLENGKKIERQLDSVAFASTQQFKKAIKKIAGIDMVFNGTEADLVHIQEFMNSKYRDYNHCKGINYIGLQRNGNEWIYIGTDGAIDSKGKPINSIVSIIEDNEALKSNIIETEVISKEELEHLSPALFSFNTYERTIGIIGWVCVCFLKERLRQRRIKLSHLVMAGGAGSGKSETLEKIIQPIFSLMGSGIACKGLTNFSVLKSTSSTNLIPIIFEEYKPHRLNPAELNLISGTLRSVYDHQTTQRGRQDQSVVNYMRRSPIILVGESSFDETAIKERIIDIQFAKSDRTDDHTKNYKALSKQEKTLNKLGKTLLQLVLGMEDKDLDDLISQSKIFEKCEFETRTILGLSNVYLGILLLNELYKKYDLSFGGLTGIDPPLVYASLVGCTLNSLDGNTKVHSAVDLIIQVFDNMALKNRIKKGYEYIVNSEKNELCLRINLIYDEFTKYVREFNVQDVEVLTTSQFTKQLRKEPYFSDYALRTFKTCVNEKNTTTRQRCFVIDLEKVNNLCALEAFKAEDVGYKADEDGFLKIDEDSQMELPFEE